MNSNLDIGIQTPFIEGKNKMAVQLFVHLS